MVFRVIIHHGNANRNSLEQDLTVRPPEWLRLKGTTKSYHYNGKQHRWVTPLWLLSYWRWFQNRKDTETIMGSVLRWRGRNSCEKWKVKVFVIPPPQKPSWWTVMEIGNYFLIKQPHLEFSCHKHLNVVSWYCSSKENPGNYCPLL